MQKLINLPFFHLHVQTLGQMVLKALEAARRVIRANISILTPISCQADIFPSWAFCQAEFFSIFNLSRAHQQLLAPPPHHVWVFLSLLNADQRGHNFWVFFLYFHFRGILWLRPTSTITGNQHLINHCPSNPSLTFLPRIHFFLLSDHIFSSEDYLWSHFLFSAAADHLLLLLNQLRSFCLRSKCFFLKSERWETLLFWLLCRFLNWRSFDDVAGFKLSLALLSCLMGLTTLISWQLYVILQYYGFSITWSFGQMICAPQIS